MNYQEYIESPGWKSKAKYIKEHRGNKCQVCGISGKFMPLHVHHNNYDRIQKELDIDLVVLCRDCHKLFHDAGMKPERQIILTNVEIKSILWEAGITYTNDDPWRYYELGKEIIDQLAQGDCRLYDRYNSVNSEIVSAACVNEVRRAYKKARDSGDWNGYYNEIEYRRSNEYWEGWHE